MFGVRNFRVRFVATLIVADWIFLLLSSPLFELIFAFSAVVPRELSSLFKGNDSFLSKCEKIFAQPWNSVKHCKNLRLTTKDFSMLMKPLKVSYKGVASTVAFYFFVYYITCTDSITSELLPTYTYVGLKKIFWHFFVANSWFSRHFAWHVHDTKSRVDYTRMTENWEFHCNCGLSPHT